MKLIDIDYQDQEDSLQTQVCEWLSECPLDIVSSKLWKHSKTLNIEFSYEKYTQKEE